MNRIVISILPLVLLSVLAVAQSPAAFKYQAVVRDANGKFMANQSVSFRISILQENASDTSQYSEIHTTTTNLFGLANLEIGNGSSPSSDFSVIDWAMDTYFIQIELDVNGGSEYQLMGISQLLSVPYALHAQKADFAQQAQVADIALNDFDTDPINEMELPEGGSEGEVLTTDGKGNYSWTIIGNDPTTYTKGLNSDLGGYVFYVTPDGRHGLVASTRDQGIWDWFVAHSNISTPDNHTETGKNFIDWRMPTKDELNMMYIDKDAIGGFSSGVYWSSTEFNTFSAWGQSFFNGNQSHGSQEVPNPVRAVRSF